MAFVVVYDACALYGNTVRNLLIRLDPDDRHVLAAAIKAGAQVIVTADLADFPGEYLAQWGIEARGLDDFVLDFIGINDRVVHACVQQIVDERSNPPETF